jgi:signal transduction histidine kinase
MTADLASLFRAAIERGKIEFIVDCEADPQEGRHIYLASELWEKIVFNLIGNAYKYTMSGKIVVKVTFTAKEGIFQVIGESPPSPLLLRY